MSAPGPEQRRRAVVDGEVVYTSASALQLAHRCLRAWFFKYKVGLPDEKKSKGLQRGLEGHARIEHYLITGQDILDPLERLGVARGYVPEFLPLGARVEQKIDGVATAGPIPMVGKIDLYLPPDASGKASVRDWKFKSDIGRWGCSADDLIDPDHEAGIQMLSYASFAVKQGAREVEVSHVSFQTTGRPDVSLVSASLSAELVADKCGRLLENIVPEIIEAAKAAGPSEVRADYNACGKYGGCPFKATCLNRAAQMKDALKKITRT